MEILAVGFPLCAGELGQNSWNKQEFIFTATKGPFIVLLINVEYKICMNDATQKSL